MEEKISWLLEHHYNLFHADMLQRAIYDNKISLSEFETGCLKIEKMEADNGDEYTPSEFKNV